MKGILQKFKKMGLNVVQTEFTEDGYEMWIKPLNCDESERFITANLRQNLDKLEMVDYSGYIPTEYTLDKGVCKLLLVPKGVQQITDFIWEYIEKIGDSDGKVEEQLMYACCALEKSIERIPEIHSEAKKEAERNYISFSKIIF